MPLHPWGGPLTGSTERSISGHDLIYWALRYLRFLRPGHGANSETIDDGLAALNDLIDSWNAERLSVPGYKRELWDLAAGQTEYLLGDHDGSRPAEIPHAALIRSGSTDESPVNLLTAEQWADGMNGVYVDWDYPVATAHVRPAPNAGDQLVLYVWQRLAFFESTETSFSFAPGYTLALKYGLAAQLAPALPGKIPHDLMSEVYRQAQSSKARIQRRNVRPILVRADIPQVRVA